MSDRSHPPSIQSMFKAPLLGEKGVRPAPSLNLARGGLMSPKGVAPGMSPMLQWMAPHASSTTKLWSGCVCVEGDGKEETKGREDWRRGRRERTHSWEGMRRIGVGSGRNRSWWRNGSDQNTLYIMYVCLKISKYKIYVKIPLPSRKCLRSCFSGVGGQGSCSKDRGERLSV